MDQTILQTLFLDNLEIPAELAKFCDTIPEYVQAEQAFKQASRELEAWAISGTTTLSRSLPVISPARSGPPTFLGWDCAGRFCGE